MASAGLNMYEAWGDAMAEGATLTQKFAAAATIATEFGRIISAASSMIGPRAGCRYVERIHPYLNNLHRLGLVWFSRETLRDAHRYQVIEAQPDVLAAMKSVRMAKLVRRSIHLTPFGSDFCRDCLALDGGHVPEHGVPASSDDVTSPPAPA